MIRLFRRKKFDAGVSAGRAAAEIDLGPYAMWTDADRIATNLARVYARLVSLKLLLVLREHLPRIRDGGNAKTYERRDQARDVAHEISVELPRLKSSPQRIRLKREVIHAYLFVASLLKHHSTLLIKSAFLVAGRQVKLCEAALSGLDPGDVRVGVEGYAVWTKTTHGFNRLLHAPHGL